ncbi:hypothetical protein [Haloarcula rubripromontorii]|uniref:hypothetical protein n=1 Tax=Haloarcula rubripromontorii TaxID=1705562 RepID=UPI00345BC44A
MAPTIKARDDVDGCGCLECRNIDTINTNRTVLDALVWSVRLFRSYPSILAFTGMVILANRLLETDSVAVLPMPVIDIIEGLTAFVFIISLRTYVGTIVAGELTNDPVTIREGLRRSISRTPALVGLIFIIVFSIMTIPFLVFVPLVLLVGMLPVTPAEIVNFPVAIVVGMIIFAVPFLFFMFKFWFAPEACVIGQYGPFKSLRVSWRITSNYRGKFLLIVVIAIGSAVNFYLPAVIPQTETGLTVVHPVLHIISSSASELLSIVWASAYAHIYVQGVVS